MKLQEILQNIKELNPEELKSLKNSIEQEINIKSFSKEELITQNFQRIFNSIYEEMNLNIKALSYLYVLNDENIKTKLSNSSNYYKTFFNEIKIVTVNIYDVLSIKIHKYLEGLNIEELIHIKTTNLKKLNIKYQFPLDEMFTEIRINSEKSYEDKSKNIKLHSSFDQDLTLTNIQLLPFISSLSDNYNIKDFLGILCHFYNRKNPDEILPIFDNLLLFLNDFKSADNYETKYNILKLIDMHRDFVSFNIKDIRNKMEELYMLNNKSEKVSINNSMADVIKQFTVHCNFIFYIKEIKDAYNKYINLSSLNYKSISDKSISNKSISDNSISDKSILNTQRLTNFLSDNMSLNFVGFNFGNYKEIYKEEQITKSISKRKKR